MYALNMENPPKSQSHVPPNQSTNTRPVPKYFSYGYLEHPPRRRRLCCFCIFERGKLPQPQRSRDPMLPPSRDIRHATIFGWEREEVTQDAPTGTNLEHEQRSAKRVSSHPTKNPVAPEATGFRPMQLGCDLSVLGHQDRPWAAEATRLAAPCSYFRVSASNTEAWASTIPRGVLSRSPQSRAPSDRLPILARRATKNLSAEPRPCDWVGHEGQH